MRKLKTKKSSLLKKPRQIIGSGRSFDEQRMGTEPVFDDNSTTSDIMHGLNWYSHFHEADQSKKWMLEYMKHAGYSKEDVQQVKSFPWGKAGILVDGPKTVYLKGGGFLARMILRGFEKLPKEYVDKIKFYIDYSKEKGVIVSQQKSAEKKLNGNGPSIQAHIKEQVSIYASEIEQSIDDFVDNNYEPTISVYDWLVSKEVKGLIAKKIGNEFQPYLTEIKSIPTDEDLAESYAHMKKKQLVKYENFIQTIISDCERYSVNFSKQQRKPRKKKPISISKQIAKLNYKKQDNEYKIASINPSEIVGADQLYVFNSKYRKLGVYKAEGPAGLSVKGSTLRGFDLSLSKCKKVRKPEEVLTKMLSGGKLAIKRQYDSINSVEKDLTGRINNETILLKIVK